MKRIVFLDVETTGLFVEQGDRVIELGCVETINGFITGRVFHSYFNPNIKICQNAFNIHGITNEFLLNKPNFRNKINEFLGFIKNSTIIAHNAKFDIDFLNKEFYLSNFKIFKVQDFSNVLDSLFIFRKLHPRKKNNLNDLCIRYNLIKSKNRLHGALKDAYLLALLVTKISFLEKDFIINL